MSKTTNAQKSNQQEYFGKGTDAALDLNILRSSDSLAPVPIFALDTAATASSPEENATCHLVLQNKTLGFQNVHTGFLKLN